MKKIVHLSTCSTCQRIIKSLNNGEGFEMQDIKVNNLSAKQLDDLKEKVGSYEAMFSRRAMKYRSLGLNDMELGEKDYRDWILKEYTFLKRPVIIIDDEVFVGNSKKIVETAQNKLANA